MITGRPDRSEAADYYFTYIDRVAAGDIVSYLSAQADEAIALLESVSEEQSLRRYAPDKWSIREVAGHVSDVERVFGFRALWFARGVVCPGGSIRRGRVSISTPPRRPPARTFGHGAATSNSFASSGRRLWHS